MANALDVSLLNYNYQSVFENEVGGKLHAQCTTHTAITCTIQI